MDESSPAATDLPGPLYRQFEKSPPLVRGSQGSPHFPVFLSQGAAQQPPMQTYFMPLLSQHSCLAASVPEQRKQSCMSSLPLGSVDEVTLPWESLNERPVHHALQA